MKRIAFVGQPSREKTFFILYMAHILSQAHKTVVQTEDLWFSELDVHVYSDNLTILKKNREGADRDTEFFLEDLYDFKDNPSTLRVLVSQANLDSVNGNQSLFERSTENDEVIYLFLGMVLDSKINEKYLCRRMGIHGHKDEVLCQYLNEKDLAVNMENEYDERLSIRGLSKPYKYLLMHVIRKVSEAPLGEQRRWLRKAERSR